MKVFAKNSLLLNDQIAQQQARSRHQAAQSLGNSRMDGGSGMASQGKSYAADDTHFNLISESISLVCSKLIELLSPGEDTASPSVFRSPGSKHHMSPVGPNSSWKTKLLSAHLSLIRWETDTLKLPMARMISLCF